LTALRHLAAQPDCIELFDGDGPNHDGAVLLDHPIGEAFGACHHLGRESAALEVDGARVVSHMKGHGVQIAGFYERPGEHVLSRVLLHVIESTVPVDRAVDVPRRWRTTFHGVQHRLALALLHIDDGEASDAANIRRLSARGGVEIGLVQVHGMSAAVQRLRTHDDTTELRGVGIVEVQLFRFRDLHE
jgi:hypothetical protein